jgi:heme-degrading monooxygenase HmoA
MVFRISSVFVPLSDYESYVAYLLHDVATEYAQAEGFVSILILHRTLVAYSEVVIISSWQSERAMTEFFEAAHRSATQRDNLCSAQIERDPPHVYGLVVRRRDEDP